MSLSLSLSLSIYIYIYRSEGFALTGYDIPGCVEDGAWMLWILPSSRSSRSPTRVWEGAVIGYITISALLGCAD